MLKRILRILVVFLFVAVVLIARYTLFPPAIVDQSTTPLTLANTPGILASTLPPSAKKIEYAISSVGMGGRFRAYRFTGDINQLRTHVTREFSQAPLGTPAKLSNQVPNLDLPFFERAYKVNLSWFDVSTRDNCEVYRRPIEHGPLIILNLDSSTLYYLWSD